MVDSARVQELPLNGRNFLQLALLSGGAVAPTTRSDAIGGQTGRSDNAVILGGNVGSSTGYLINGIATRGGRLGESAMNISPAAIDQFKVQMSFFMPDQGPNPGSGQSHHEVRRQQLPRRVVRVLPEREARCAKLLFAWTGEAPSKSVRRLHRRTDSQRSHMVLRELRRAAGDHCVQRVRATRLQPPCSAATSAAFPKSSTIPRHTRPKPGPGSHSRAT